MNELNESVWPVDLDQVRLWPMESKDGLLLQELFDDLADFRTAFGEPGAADSHQGLDVTVSRGGYLPGQDSRPKRKSMSNPHRTDPELRHRPMIPSSGVRCSAGWVITRTPDAE
jgi:hypothetical protein